jgi:hypothetical protein
MISVTELALSVRTTGRHGPSVQHHRRPVGSGDWRCGALGTRRSEIGPPYFSRPIFKNGTKLLPLHPAIGSETPSAKCLRGLGVSPKI